jgi:transcriptional regulator with XRE-family HTH domain
MFSERLRELRCKKGLAQKVLAYDLGVSLSSIGMWETSKRAPDHTMLIKIAEYFETSTDYLLGRTQNPDPLGKLLVVPDELKNVPMAAVHGEEDWTQDEYDMANAFVYMVREQKKNR